MRVSHNDARSLLLAERDENTCRKDMTLSERVAVGRAIEELEKPSAAERMAQAKGKPRGSKKADVSSGTVTGVDPKDFGDVRDIVGAAVGLSGAQYHRAKVVVGTMVPNGKEVERWLPPTGRPGPGRRTIGHTLGHRLGGLHCPRRRMNPASDPVSRSVPYTCPKRKTAR